jgi:hypothetical protein
MLAKEADQGTHQEVGEGRRKQVPRPLWYPTGLSKTQRRWLHTTTKMFIVLVGDLYFMLANESNTHCVIQKMAHFFCRLLSTDTKDVSYHNATDTKELIYGVGCPSIADNINLCSRWGKESLVSCDLASRYQIWIYGVGSRKPADTIWKIQIITIFEYFKFIHDSNSYRIQIHTGFKFT